ncbi:MAG: tRNA (5-methylaminomethyl-2-thiouridine)(34)-methyltransferase MnmD [Planctomycetes bacterium]|nr:tRNA (5-methylaminomethyl-2-thiouridine)(34)-methyltransferase MnmD [Planctomycetota bacterium]
MPAIARFDDDGRLRSTRYGDVYFAGDGTAQAEHVFVGGNDLPRRFAAAVGPFVVAETGFGAGMNFLTTLAAFERHAAPTARLVFVSTEQDLLDDATLAAAHQRLPPAFADAAATLRAALARGDDRVAFDRARATLCLLRGDALASLRRATFAAHAWFLDGFAPSKNPQMWTPELLAEVAAHTRPGGTAATYTVASDVRRGLERAGFAPRRAPGFGDKREMLTATLVRDGTERATTGSAPTLVHVRGAGIAGAAAAHAFARRGCRVTVIAPNGVADGASGIPAAAVRPRLWRASANTVPDAEIVADAFRWTSDWLQRRAEPSFRRCGVLLCATDDDDVHQVRARAQNPATADIAQWCERAEASSLAGVALPFGAAWIPTGGVVDLGRLTRDLLCDPRIEVRAHEAGTPDLVVDATARIADGELVRGQAIAVPLSARAPRAVLCTNGYLCPPDDDGLAWLGSTYDRDDQHLDPREADDERVRARFAGLPSVAAALAAAPTARRFVGVRAATPQRVPRVGLPSPGRAVTLAHGSRGAVTGPWAAEVLAAACFDEPMPLRASHWSRLQERAASTC